MKITYPLPEPTCCDHCNSPNIFLAENKIRKSRGRRLHAWVCRDCDATVSCHEGTRIPLGFMTDKEGGKLRKDLHLCFDRIWLDEYMSREEAYEWLAIKLLKPRKQMHISWLTKPELREAMVICKKELDHLEKIKERREVKAQAKRIKEHEQHRKHVARRIEEGFKPGRQRRKKSACQKNP